MTAVGFNWALRGGTGCRRTTTGAASWRRCKRYSGSRSALTDFVEGDAEVAIAAVVHLDPVRSHVLGANRSSWLGGDRPVVGAVAEDPHPLDALEPRIDLGRTQLVSEHHVVVPAAGRQRDVARQHVELSGE